MRIDVYALILSIDVIVSVPTLCLRFFLVLMDFLLILFLILETDRSKKSISKGSSRLLYGLNSSELPFLHFLFA